MDKNDLFDIEDRIRNAVDRAFNYVDDYNGVGKGALNEVRNHLKRGADFTQDAFNNLSGRYKEETTRHRERFRERNRNYNSGNNYNKSNKKAVSMYIAKRPAGTISGVLLSFFGIAGTILFGVTAFGMFIGMLADPSFRADYINAAKACVFAFSVGAVLNLGLAFKGSNIRKRLKRFKNYSACIGEKSYCKINFLANSVGESDKFVLKDLEKMIKFGMFRQAYFDDERTYIMLGNNVYEEYLKSKEAFNKRKEEAKKEEAEANDNSEIAIVKRQGKEYINEIRSANDAIPGEVISDKLDKLEKVVSAIFSNIEKNPNKISDVKKFINHYLPMTLKLVNSYKELDAQVIQGENIKSAKLEIEKSIDLVNSAFEKLLDDLFADVAMDVSSDRSVLETLFSQEGLTDDELRKKK